MFRYVSAGAGCGKTTFIINEIKDIIKNQKSKILVITYTNSCVEEIKQRIDKEESLATFVDVYTFHGLCSKYGNMQGLFSENNHLKLLLDYVNNEYYFPESFEEFYNYFLCHTPINNYIEVLKEKYVRKADKELNEYRESIKELKLEDYITSTGTIRLKRPSYIPKQDEQQWLKNKEIFYDYFQTLNRDYNFLYFKQALEVEETRKQTNIFTYHHLILNVLENIESFIESIYSIYDHIFIDEVQDLSHIQFKIIEKLSEELVYLTNKTITIVGDENQSIYSFQGANKENFHRFLQYIQSIPGMLYEQVYLDKTYRFGGEILDFVNNTFALHKSDNPTGSIVLHPLASNRNEIIKQIYQEVTEVMNNYPNESILLLFHRRSSLTIALEEQFSSVKITRKISGKDPLLNSFFALVKFVIFANNSELIKFLLGGWFIIPEPEFCQIVTSYKQDNLWNIISNTYITKEEVAVINQLISIKNLKDFISVLTNSRLHYNAYNFYGGNVNCLLQELSKLGDISLIYLLELENKDLWSEQQGKVHFSTIHNSKGMEADNVFIIDGNAKPGNSRITLTKNCPFYNFIQTESVDNQEFRNLLYVSVTRAKRCLQIFGVKEKHLDTNSLYYIIDKWKNRRL